VGFAFGPGTEAVAIPDVNADHVDDVLVTTFGSAPTVGVRSGRDGRLLWRRSVPNLSAALFVAAPGGGGLVMTVTDTYREVDTPVAVVGTDNTTFAALTARTGASRWSTSVSGSYEFDLVDGGDVDVAVWSGVLTRRHASPYLLLSRVSVYFTPTSVAGLIRPEVVNTADGTAVGNAAPLAGDDIPDANTVGDLNGDGTDDFAVFVGGDVEMISTDSGANGQTLWDQQTSGWPRWVLDGGDLTGDRKADLLVDAGDASGPSVDALAGTDGSAVWSAPGDFGIPIGDINRDRKTDVLVTTFDRALVLYAVTGRGTPRWQRTLTAPSGPNQSVGVWVGTDLSGDRIPDAFVLFSGKDEGVGTTKGSGTVVDGRTGRLRPVGDSGVPVYGSLDGHGDDLVSVRQAKTGVVVTARDGRDGRRLWTRTLHMTKLQSVDWLEAARLGRSGAAGLLAVLTLPTSDQVMVLGGRRGELRWSSSYPSSSSGPIKVD
jgi:hypothetical protein